MISLIEAHNDALTDLCHRFGVERLHVFGSATGEAFDDDASDLDFLVEFGRVQGMTMADQFFGLLDGLEKLFGRPVDLLTRRSLRNPYLVRSIEQSRRLVYAA